MDPAEHPGIRDRLAVRPDDPAFHGDARAERDRSRLHALALAARLRIAGEERVGVHARTARLTIEEQAPVELLEHVIVGGPPTTR